MRKTVISVIVAILLVVIGGIIFILAMRMKNWNFNAVGDKKYETNTFDITEEFSDISITSDTEDIVFVPAVDGKCKVTFYESKKEKHTAKVENGTLVIKMRDNRKWYDYISFFSFGTKKITVYLPQSEYDLLYIKESTGEIDIPGDFNFCGVDIDLSTGNVNFAASSSGNVNIMASTGDIKVKSISAGQLNLAVSTGRVDVTKTNCQGDVNITVSTGKINFNDLACLNLNSSGSTGDITLENVICSEKMNIKRSTGDVKLNGSDAGEIIIETDTGDVSGTLRSGKVFITKSDTGKIDVPETVTGGKCKITTDTGDIKISIE
ncbi:MAG: DUF4097 family beta strand repeat protein [Clostridia bacterium]|nr:DUF4097 family beta strand repeat protein [Clostridia bacterium]